MLLPKEIIKNIIDNLLSKTMEGEILWIRPDVENYKNKINSIDLKKRSLKSRFKNKRLNRKLKCLNRELKNLIKENTNIYFVASSSCESLLKTMHPIYRIKFYNDNKINFELKIIENEIAMLACDCTLENYFNVSSEEFGQLITLIHLLS
jgi:hypothetical protein